MMAMSTLQLRERYVATGQATKEDIDCFLAFAADPGCRATYFATVRGSGRKTAGGGNAG
jgi:hypothetical protein